MFKIFFFIVFFAVLLFLLAGFSIIRTVKSFFFGPSNATHAKRHTASSSRRSDQASASRTPIRKKVIAEDEGEYIDYEEIK